MSPRIFSCVLCGYVVYDYENPNSESWLKQFRILYSSPTEISVSGVGLYNDFNAGKFIVPLEYTSRWDDPGYDFPDRDQIGVMTQHPVNNRHGFIFHEACWALLEKIHHPQPISYSQLLEVCKSMPFPLRATGVSWGHDFGGLVLLDNEDHYPWEDSVSDRGEDSKQCISARENPKDVPEIEQLLREPSQSIPALGELGSTGQVRRSVDVFSKLPREICDMIACLLPTSDVYSLRQTSIAFISVFSNQQFWASRFTPHSDRCWLFELWNVTESLNWRWLYRRTSDTRMSPALRNSKRVWKLVQSLKDIISLHWNETSKESVSHGNVPSRRYREIAGDVMRKKSPGSYHDFNEGCRLFHQQYVSFPQFISEVAFSTVQVGDTDYVSGMQLVSSEGAVIELGYLPKKKGFSGSFTNPRGFNVAVGSRGIQAIQVITDKQHTSQWVGSPTGSPITRYLAVYEPIRAVKAGFDGCKMVSLAVEFNISSVIDTSTEETRSLRDTALWYPEVPGHNLFLNDHRSLVTDYSPIEYQPLCWALFGGPGGIYLQSLTGISVSYLGTLRDIEFSYATDSIPAQSCKLGRRKFSKYAKLVHFPIDGPGGETIEAVEVSLKYMSGENVYSFCKHGALKAFKISTNRGRNCYFGHPPDASDQTEVKAIAIAPGTTITGFYVSQHSEMGLTSLGVISEITEKSSGKLLS